jgi:metal-responsive CopG/Arc/MetJ family transcriptional regulator
MKVRTSIALPGDLLERVDRQSAGFKSRSDFIEAAIRAYVDGALQTDDRRDFSILNKRADRLNREAADVLDYQIIP